MIVPAGSCTRHTCGIPAQRRADSCYLDVMQICVGPVCVPMNLLLPFLVGLAHRAGWLSWFRRDWVTLQYWRSAWCNTEQNKCGSLLTWICVVLSHGAC